jgi:hypothetical protein
VVKCNVISTSAVGGDVTSDVVMSRVARDALMVEITVGARPGQDHGKAAREHGLSTIAHHAFPGSDGVIVSPDRHHPEQVLDEVLSIGATFYSLHPAKLDSMTDLLLWSDLWIEMASRRGIEIAFETMNPVFKQGTVSRQHALDSGSDVLLFTEHLIKTPAGILADAAHILIGLRLGLWEQWQVEELAATQKVTAMHVSAPAALKDSHKPRTHDPEVEALCAILYGSSTLYAIDEGRRTKNG